eukprot:328880-Pyramimonas_sp.AAC.1
MSTARECLPVGAPVDGSRTARIIRCCRAARSRHRQAEHALDWEYEVHEALNGLYSHGAPKGDQFLSVRRRPAFST